jgi:hypothetical protein
MDTVELKGLLRTVLDDEADWEERVDAFREAVSGCQESEEYDEEDEDEEIPKRGGGPGLALIFGKEKK